MLLVAFLTVAFVISYYETLVDREALFKQVQDSVSESFDYVKINFVPPAFVKELYGHLHRLVMSWTSFGFVCLAALGSSVTYMWKKYKQDGPQEEVQTGRPNRGNVHMRRILF